MTNSEKHMDGKDEAAEYLMGVRAAYFRAQRLRTMALEQSRSLGIVRGVDYSASKPHGNATDADGAMLRAIDAADRASKRADEAEAEWSALCDEASAAAARMEDALEECERLHLRRHHEGALTCPCKLPRRNAAQHAGSLKQSETVQFITHAYTIKLVYNIPWDCSTVVRAPIVDECDGGIIRTHESASHTRGLLFAGEKTMEHGNSRNVARSKRKRSSTAGPANLNDRKMVEWKASHPKRGDILSCFSQSNGVSGL